MQLKVEKMIYGGEGLARLPADERGPGKAVFLPFVLPGESVSAEIQEEKPGFVRAVVTEILSPSPARVAPQCPYFSRCGGCHYQHATYEHQLEIKEAILRETLRRTARLEWTGAVHVHPSPPWEYRNRARWRLRAAPEFALGYYQMGSHDLLPVERCPISSPALNRALAALWELGRAEKIAASVREVEIAADHEDERLLVEIFAQREDVARGEASEVYTLVELLWNTLPCAAVCVFDRPAAPAWGWSENQDFFYAAANAKLRVSPGSFFQANRFLLDQLVAIVTGNRSGKLALDLYAGVGLFSVALAPAFENIMAVESSPPSWSDLEHNAPANLLPVRATTAEFLEKRGKKLRPDLVIVDPPREGLGKTVTRALAVLSAPQLVYVSCDPATLSRDLRGLLESGYRVEEVHLVDLFPQTFHIESVFQLVR